MTLPDVLFTAAEGNGNMPIRIPWNRYEVALLFDAYGRVATGADIDMEAEKLSLVLRNMAIRENVSVDETFRNINGMKMQLSNVQYLFTGGKKGLSGASSMIRQMYDLYKNSQAEYRLILKEAIQMAGMKRKSVEEAFFAYAKDKISLKPALLAYYLSKATQFCQLKRPLLGMTDIPAVRKAYQIVSVGELLHFRNDSKEAQMIRDVTQLYYTFIKSYSEPKVPWLIQRASTNGSDEEWLIHELRTWKIPFVDHRSEDGSLWIASDLSIPISLKEAADRGYHLRLKQDGCLDFPNQPVIWTKDHAEISTKVQSAPSANGDSFGAFWQFLYKEKGFSLGKCHNYWVAIRTIEIYIQQNQLEFSLLNTDAVEAQRILDLLMERPDFEQTIIQRHRDCSDALVQYVLFLRHTGWSFSAITDTGENQRTITEVVFDVLRHAEEPMTVTKIFQAIARDNLYPFGIQKPLEVVFAGVSQACSETNVRIREGKDVLLQLKKDGQKKYQVMTAEKAAAYLKHQQKGSGLPDIVRWAEYEAVLKQAFPKGFQKESGLDMKKLRKRWAEIHGVELKDSDDTVRLQLAAHCVDTGKRWYLAELLLSDEDRQTVLQYIDRVLSSGKSVLYYSSIYAALEHQLESTVLTEDLLISYLLATCQDRYILREHYLTNDRYAQVDLSEEIKDVMLAHGRPIHTDELKQALHHLPPDQVERELHIHSEFIMDAFHMYFHESMSKLIYYIHILGDHSRNKLTTTTDRIQLRNAVVTQGEVEAGLINELRKCISKLFWNQRTSMKYNWLMVKLNVVRFRAWAAGEEDSEDKHIKIMDIANSTLNYLKPQIRKMLMESGYFNNVFGDLVSQD